ncbi:MAG TPA: hypothetical protein VG963_07125, partial [Polyangiaceae bacterium]|nr:hypothetical protein [Polyangiaceae bacterium]
PSACERLESGLYRLTLHVENHGYLPSTILSSARQLDFNEPVYAEAETRGCELVDALQRHVVLGHLEGWGRGLHSGQNTPHYQRSSGNGHRARLSFLLRGRGTIKVRAGNCRLGFVEESFEL